MTNEAPHRAYSIRMYFKMQPAQWQSALVHTSKYFARQIVGEHTHETDKQLKQRPCFDKINQHTHFFGKDCTALIRWCIVIIWI